MSWQDVIGHNKQKQQFRAAIQRNRLPSSFLFTGVAGIGKYTFARELAKTLLCETGSDEACGNCPGCAQVDAESHPDFLQVRRRPDKNRLLIEQFVGEKEKRGREGLCHDIALKPFAGGRKIAIIDDADFLNIESANSLLKTLEEPPADSVMILIGTSEQKQLRTIRSRCQVIRFDALSPEELQSVLERQPGREELGNVNELAACGGGSIQMALQLVHPEVMEFRQLLLEQLGQMDPGASDFVKTTGTFVDAAGKEAALRRDRLRLVSEFAITFFRSLLLAAQGKSLSVDESLRSSVQTAIDSGNVDAPMVADCLDRCFELQQHVTSNANQSSAIESWLTDLTRICQGGVPV